MNEQDVLYAQFRVTCCVFDAWTFHPINRSNTGLSNIHISSYHDNAHTKMVNVTPRICLSVLVNLVFSCGWIAVPFLRVAPADFFLHLHFSLCFLLSASSAEIKVGIDELLNVTVSVENKGENSYNSRVILTYPAGLSYRKFIGLLVRHEDVVCFTSSRLLSLVMPQLWLMCEVVFHRREGLSATRWTVKMESHEEVPSALWTSLFSGATVKCVLFKKKYMSPLIIAWTVD